MSQEYFTGWEKFEGIRVMESDGMKKVFLNGKPYMSWKLEDGVFQRIAIIHSLLWSRQRDI